MASASTKTLTRALWHAVDVSSLIDGLPQFSEQRNVLTTLETNERVDKNGAILSILSSNFEASLPWSSSRFPHFGVNKVIHHNLLKLTSNSAVMDKIRSLTAASGATDIHELWRLVDQGPLPSCFIQFDSYAAICRACLRAGNREASKKYVYNVVHYAEA